MACAAAGAKVWLATACCSRRAPTLMARRRRFHRSYVIERSSMSSPPAEAKTPSSQYASIGLTVRHISATATAHRRAKSRRADSTVPNTRPGRRHGHPEQPLQPTKQAPLAAIVLRLRLNKVVSQSRRPSNLGAYGTEHHCAGGVPQVVATPR